MKTMKETMSKAEIYKTPSTHIIDIHLGHAILLNSKEIPCDAEEENAL